jgi:CTP synthase
MRIGSFPCQILPRTITAKSYEEAETSERHRHSFEINNDYRDILESNGMKVAGINRERDLIEIVELDNHHFFVGVQFHPEFKSRPQKPHPLFRKFIESCI